MKNLTIILLTLISLLCWSCQDDPMDSLEDFKYRERNLLSIEFDIDQLRNPKLFRVGDSTRVDVYYAKPPNFDLSAVPVKSLKLSYKATASVQEGSTLDFNNPMQTSVITVTAESGESLDWIVYLNGF